MNRNLLDLGVFMNKLVRKCVMAIFAITLIMQNVLADNYRGRIVKVQGEVYVLDDKGNKRTADKNNFLLRSDETVVTKTGGRAIVLFNDGGLSVLSEKSSLRVEKAGWLSQLGGKVYYLFRKIVGKKDSKKIKTGFTTIGIRGTTFIVTDEENNQTIALSEGKLNMVSSGQVYEIHKQKQMDDFEAFKRQAEEKREALNQEYKDYKKQLSKDFIEYKKSFNLEENRMISFTGNRVDENELSTDHKKEFDDFELFAKDYINAYRQLEEETE